MTMKIPIKKEIYCDDCLHLHIDCLVDDGPVTCDAFPEGIPEEIYDGPVNHDRAYPGDGGIRFEAGEPRKFVRVNPELAKYILGEK